MTTEHGDDAPLLTGADPSLGDGPADGPFPDTAAGTRVVLYQTEDGAVDLRWRIDPADIAHARAAFRGAPAQPVLRLHRSGDDGADQVIAHAELSDDAAAEGGLAHYTGADGEGLLRAEIGLAGDGGGWMLIARSNGLPAATAVGAGFLREDTPAPPVPQAAGDAPAAPHSGAAAAAGRSGAKPLEERGAAAGQHQTSRQVSRQASRPATRPTGQYPI
jgi:hypothetical protein